MHQFTKKRTWYKLTKIQDQTTGEMINEYDNGSDVWCSITLNSSLYTIDQSVGATIGTYLLIAEGQKEFNVGDKVDDYVITKIPLPAFNKTVVECELCQ